MRQRSLIRILCCPSRSPFNASNRFPRMAAKSVRLVAAPSQRSRFRAAAIAAANRAGFLAPKRANHTRLRYYVRRTESMAADLGIALQNGARRCSKSLPISSSSPLEDRG
jgi:hypothetical protein